MKKDGETVREGEFYITDKAQLPNQNHEISIRNCKISPCRWPVSICFVQLPTVHIERFPLILPEDG